MNRMKHCVLVYAVIVRNFYPQVSRNRPVEVCRDDKLRQVDSN